MQKLPEAWTFNLAYLALSMSSGILSFCLTIKSNYSPVTLSAYVLITPTLWQNCGLVGTWT